MDHGSPLARMKSPPAPTQEAVAGGESALARMKAGPRHIRPVTWPGTDHKLGMRVLRGSEIQQAQLAALWLVSKATDTAHAAPIVHELHDQECLWQYLFRALVDLETGALFAESVDELRGLTELEEFEALVLELVEANPSFRDPLVSAEHEMEAAKELGKASASAMPSSGTSAGAAATSSGSRRATSPTGNSGTSSPAPSPSPPRFRRTDQAKGRARVGGSSSEADSGGS